MGRMDDLRAGQKPGQVRDQLYQGPRACWGVTIDGGNGRGRRLYNSESGSKEWAEGVKETLKGQGLNPRVVIIEDWSLDL